LGGSQLNERPLDHERIEKLLSALRERTPREITIATIAFAGCFTPEMRRALELLTTERSASEGFVRTPLQTIFS
jgi:hypothetical protein